MSLSVCHFPAYPLSTHTQLFTCIIIFLREMLVLKRRTPKLPSSMYNLHYNRFSNNIADVTILCCLSCSHSWLQLVGHCGVSDTSVAGSNSCILSALRETMRKHTHGTHLIPRLSKTVTKCMRSKLHRFLFALLPLSL